VRDRRSGEKRGLVKVRFRFVGGEGEDREEKEGPSSLERCSVGKGLMWRD
jgi:hypothetical protein